VRAAGQGTLFGMEVYLVRHGRAAPLGAADAPGGAAGDAGRPLTARGAAEVAAVARGLRALGVRPDPLLASPRLRARQTADLLAAGLASPAPRTATVLDGGAAPEEILSELRGLSAGAAVGLVGHMPGLAEVLMLAVAGIGGAGTPLEPAGAARIDFPGAPRPGAGRLVWLLPPGLLARLGGAP
jgi:phosphohistidine phosphatase